MLHSLPDLAAAIILTAYWARAMRLAYKMRLETGNAANFSPPEDIGRKIRILWRPLVAIWIAHFFINALTDQEKLPFLQWEAHREEKYLVIHHGAGYLDYCRQTGGFLPRSFRAYRSA